MAHCWQKWLAMGVIAVPLCVWGYDRVLVIHWVGHTDLDVEFSISDAATGAPIRGARVEIQQTAGGYYEDRDEKGYMLASGDDGLARKVCRSSMCFGTRSGLGFTDTFVVHLPVWRFQAVANGYEPSQWTELDVPHYLQQVRQSGPGEAKLAVAVSLDR